LSDWKYRRQSLQMPKEISSARLCPQEKILLALTVWIDDELCRARKASCIADDVPPVPDGGN